MIPEYNSLKYGGNRHPEMDQSGRDCGTDLGWQNAFYKARSQLSKSFDIRMSNDLESCDRAL